MTKLSDKITLPLPYHMTGTVPVNLILGASVVDPNPHSFGCPGSGSVLGMRIRIQEHENRLKLQINLVSCLWKRLVYIRTYVFRPNTNYKYLLLFVTFNSYQDPDPDPHGSAMVWLPGLGSGYALR